MLIGFQASRSFWRRRRRRLAGERGAWRTAPAPSPQVGAWRRTPPPAAAAASPGNARPAVVSGASAPPVGSPASAAAAAEIVLEQTRPQDGGEDPRHDPRRLVEQLQPACQALSVAACAAAAGRRARLILVTSPTVGEGKSLTALSLALGLCRVAGRPVLLVDGDGRTAGAARALGWPPEPGLWDALEGDVALEGLIGHTGLDDLWFLPPGRPLAAAAELAASRRLPEAMRALLAREPSHLVVIDGPPLLSGVAAAALAACAGQVVLMVAAGRTSQQALDDSLQRLGQRGNLSAVFARHAASARRAPAAAGRADATGSGGGRP